MKNWHIVGIKGQSGGTSQLLREVEFLVAETVPFVESPCYAIVLKNLQSYRCGFPGIPGIADTCVQEELAEMAVLVPRQNVKGSYIGMANEVLKAHQSYNQILLSIPDNVIVVAAGIYPVHPE